MTRALTWLTVAIVVATTSACSKSVETTATGAEAYHDLIQYRAKDAKPAIMNPRFVAAEEANLADGAAVIGVVIGGQARAYPLAILSDHQIVNDTVGDTPITATW